MQNKDSLNWLLGAILGTICITIVTLMGGFYLRNQKRLTEKPLVSHVLLLKSEEPRLLPPSTKDIAESHLLSRVKVKRGTFCKGSLHLFSLKNRGGPSLGYAPKKDNETWYGADFRFSVDFLKTQNDPDRPESTIEESFLEAYLIDIFRRPGNVNLSTPSPGERNGTTQTADSVVTFLFWGDSAVVQFETRSSILFVPDQAQPKPRDQKRRKQVWMIDSERKQRKRIRRRRLRPYWPELLDTSYYLPFKKDNSSLLENGVAGGSVRPLWRPFRGSFRGYAADQDGAADGGGADFWDYFDTEKGSDHFRVSEFSEFEIGVHSMDLEELKTERQRNLALSLEGNDFISLSQKLSFLDEKGSVIRYENGRGKLVKRLRFTEEAIQVHPNSESWQFELYSVQKPIASSIAFFSAKLKRIEEEISIRERQQLLEHAEEVDEKPRTREKKSPAAMLRYKREPGKKQLSRSQQKPIGEHDWRHWQRDDISYYRPLKRIKASTSKNKTSPIFQYRNTVQVDNTLQLDFKTFHNDVFDVSEES